MLNVHSQNVARRRRAAFLIWVCVKLVARWRSPRPSASSWRRCSRWRLRCQRRASTRILWTIKRSAPGPARSTHASETRERALEGRIACRSMLSRDAAPGLLPNDCGGRRVCRPTSARSEWNRVSAREIQLIHRARTTFTSSTASGTVAAAALCTVAARTRAARTQKRNSRKDVYHAIWGCAPLHNCAPPHLLTAHERAPCAESVEVDVR